METEVLIWLRVLGTLPLTRFLFTLAEVINQVIMTLPTLLLLKGVASVFRDLSYLIRFFRNLATWVKRFIQLWGGVFNVVRRALGGLKVAYPLPANLPDNYTFNVAFEVFRPFGSGSSALDSGSGTLLDNIPCGSPGHGGWLNSTHILVCNPNVKVIDGCSRSSGGNSILYTDGDEIRAYTYFGYIRFVVVWVSYIPDGSVGETEYSGYKVVYLMRVANVHVLGKPTL